MHQMHAEAVDNAGGRGVSGFIEFAVTAVTNPPPGSNAVPIVTWMQPSNGAAFALGSPILLKANAADSDGTLSSIDFLAGTNLLRRLSGTLTNGVYSFMWSNAPAGTHQLQAVAGDNLGQRGYSAIVEVNVSGDTNVPPNNLAPVISWIQLTNGSSFPGSPILLTAQATDADGTVSYVDFYATPTNQPSTTVNLGRVFGPHTNNLYSLSWSNVSAGAFHLQAVAGDNLGQRGYSAIVEVNVGGGTNVPPTTNMWPIVTWISPTNGAAFAAGTPILLKLSVSDSDGAVTNLNILDYTRILWRFSGPLTNGIYTFNWTNAAIGSHSLRAIALDNNGASGQSVPVQIVVGGGGGGMVDLGIVQPSTIGHAFFDPNLVPPYNMPRSVNDFLVDQDQSSGGGGVLGGVSVNWDTNSQFKLTVAAPNGMKFLVNVPAGRHVKFGGFLWWESTRGGFSAPGDVTATFTDLEGTAPLFGESDSVLSDSHGFFGFVDLESSGVSNNFSFTSITLTGTVEPIYTGNGSENYVPHLESSMYLTYSTTATNDPGSFVSIAPVYPAPIIRLVSTLPGTGVSLVVYGQAGRTYIVECSPDTATWTAISSGVMPAMGSMPISDASAATVASRFYRVVELP
jgi:hypothetical protein